MADYAHTETDKAIEKLEKRLQAEYRQAYRETKGKLEKYLSDFARKDEAKRKLVDEGKLSQADYKKWRTNQMLTGQRWVKMVDTLAKDMNRTNQIAADIISGQLSPTFALNANFAAYGIENGFQTDFGFTLYNEDAVNRLIEENPDLLPAPRVDIPEDIRWNKQKITSNITQAVLQGKSIPEIAKTMQTVVGMNKASATRNARTAMTGAQNAGRQATYDKAKAMGIKVKKEWMATLDGRTRHSHGMADGQQVEIDGKFKVGASELRYPSDPQGRPEEIYNCRCTMVTVEPPEILQGEEPRKTYQEWYKGKENSLNLKNNSGIIKQNTKTKEAGKTMSKIKNDTSFSEKESVYGKTFSYTTNLRNKKTVQIQYEPSQSTIDEYQVIGIRAVPREQEGKYKIGNVLPESYDWDFENDVSTYYTTKKTLGGSSALEIRVDDYDTLEEAIQKCLEGTYEYEGKDIFIVGGKYVNNGDDTNEVIIKNATAIGKIGIYGEKENIPEISSLKIKVAKPAKTKLKEIKENIESVSLPTVKEKVEDVSQKSKKELFEEFKKEMLAKYSNVQPWQVYENLNSDEKKKWNALR